MLIKIDTHEYPVTEQEFLRRHPDTSFPATIQYADFGYAVVFPTPAPAVDWYHAARETPPVMTAKGTWEQAWEVVEVPRTPEEIAQRLADAKTTKSAAVQAEKVRARDAGFTVNEILWDSDQSARVSYAGVAIRLMVSPTFSTPWKASQGVWVTMDAATYAAVSAAGEAHIQSVFGWQAARDAEIAAATTVEAVQAVSEHYAS